LKEKDEDILSRSPTGEVRSDDRISAESPTGDARSLHENVAALYQAQRPRCYACDGGVTCRECVADVNAWLILIQAAAEARIATLEQQLANAVSEGGTDVTPR
jgi:hypothetical protein